MKLSVYDPALEAHKEVDLVGFVRQLKSLGLTVEECSAKVLDMGKSHVETLTGYGFTEEEAVEKITSNVQEAYDQE